ncbi:MAG: amino-acid N-acetyltransferase [Actinomycetota bacterium]|nr:amino-acid N-acetyltransferase [Actinomycetota bacterium]
MPPADLPSATPIAVRRARVGDIRRVKELIDYYAGEILLEKTLVNLYEDTTEFWVAEYDGQVVGCGALHVLWEDLAEIRTLATDPAFRGRGVGRTLCAGLIAEAGRLGVGRLFVLTFEVMFFAALGFRRIAELNMDEDALAELRSSYDRGVAEFLELPYVKPNTLGNTRMLKLLEQGAD